MFKDNLFQMRKLRHMTQEELAEKIGVTRQAVAKWEAGDSVPDLEKSRLLAECLDVSLSTSWSTASRTQASASAPALRRAASTSSAW